jgi:hypothetical protein
MKLMTATATALLIASGAQAQIDEAQTKALVERFVACFEGKVTGAPDSERLTCYDALSSDIIQMVETGAPVEGTSCQITAFTMNEPSGNMRVMSGESSCREGRFSYRLTRDGEFLTAGSAFVRGFVFEDVVTFSGPSAGIQMSFDFQ